jgi:hypothetical protein
MEPPEGESGPRPATRSSRILGLVAAVGFSIAMWVFIAVAVLGLILKVIGPRGAQEGLEAAGLVAPQPLYDKSVTDEELSKDWPSQAAPAAVAPLGPVTQPLLPPAAAPAPVVKPQPSK